MIVFGIDIPLVEVIFALSIIIFILLVEVIVLIVIQMKQSEKSKKLVQLVEQLSDTILEIKRAEVKELDNFKRR